jgi:uncharacterized protein (TIGR03083 family)
MEGPTEPLEALRASVGRLHDAVVGFDATALAQPAYPTEWSVADVLSHLGSGAVIFARRIGDTLAGRDTPDDFAPSTWAEWNAKSPTAQAADALVTDAALLAQLDGLTQDERQRLAVPFGPARVDFDAAVGLRLNEHCLHSWDIDVVFRPEAGLGPDTTACVIDNLEMIARFIGKPTGSERVIVIRTEQPERRFTVQLTPDSVSLAAGPGGDPADVELPAESFIRLVYGRLDPNHTPGGITGEDALDELRRVFPGL